MGAINDFKSEMKAIEKISEISIRAVETSRRGLGNKGVQAAVLAGALAMATVMQDANAMTSLAPESMVSETIMNISRTFNCEGTENSQITLAALDGMSTCVALFGAQAGMVDIGPEFSEYKASISQNSEPASHLSEDVLASIQGYASTAWDAVTENGPFKSVIEAIAAFSALIEAVKYLRAVIEKTMGRTRENENNRSQVRINRRREPVLGETEAEADDSRVPEVANGRIEPDMDIDSILDTDAPEAANDNDDSMQP